MYIEDLTLLRIVICMHQTRAQVVYIVNIHVGVVYGAGSSMHIADLAVQKQKTRHNLETKAL